jgi:hypothetical protein
MAGLSSMKKNIIIDVHMHADSKAGGHTISKARGEFSRNGVALGLINSLGVKTWSQYPTEQEVRGANRQARSLAGKSGGILKWLAYINPQNKNWRREIDLCRAEGAVGIKLWVALKDKHYRLDNAEKVLDYAGKSALPALIHTFNRTDASLPGEVNVAELMELAERHPQTRMIVAHAGIHWPSEIQLLRPLRNVWVECGGGYPIKGQVEALVRMMGADRVLFGSDIFCRSQASQLVKVILADLPQAQKNKILSGNAISLFGLRDSFKAGSQKPKLSECRVDVTEDHFCFCGQWPFFKTDCASPRELESVLKKTGIKRAYAADLGSVYRQDLLPANDAFLAACRGLKCVRPLAVINPRVPDWKSVLEKTPEKFAGIIIFPHLHNWSLSDPRAAGLLRLCAKRDIPVWINCRLDDFRFRHPGTVYHGVSTEELLMTGAAPEAPQIVFQGVFEDAMDEFLKRHGSDNRFKFTITHLADYPQALRRILKQHGPKRLVMGSEYPFRDIRQVRWTCRRV